VHSHDVILQTLKYGLREYIYIATYVHEEVNDYRLLCGVQVIIIPKQNELSHFLAGNMVRTG